MKERILKLVEGVDNIELFYDLIFVYCISIITGVAHHHGAELIELHNYLSYLLPLLVVLQIWFYTTLLMNRYGAHSASDYICLFINMFLLYFMASSIGGTTEADFNTFDIAWALILVNLIVHWLIKRFAYSNIDSDDKLIIDRTVVVLVIQLVLVIISCALQGTFERVFSIIALFVGIVSWTQRRIYRLKPSHFAHLAERCVLLIIITFGETIVAISTYMTADGDYFYSILVFALVVGMFLIYNYEYDRMLDHNSDTDGMGYMALNAWIILVVSNLTIALEFMPDSDIPFVPKSIYLTSCLVLYLVTSFLLTFYSKPEFKSSIKYTLGRLGMCILIILAALLTNFDPRITLVVDVIAVYGALLHEWALFHTRSAFIARAKCMGFTNEMLVEAGYDLGTKEGRLAFSRDSSEILKQWEESDSENCK